MKKTEHPVVYALVRGAEFVNSVAEIVSLGASKLMSHGFEPQQARGTLQKRVWPAIRATTA